MVASAHMRVVTAKVAGVPRIVTCAPPFNGKPAAGDRRGQHLAGADEIYCLGGVQAVGAMALGTERIRAGRHARRPRQRLRRRSQAPAFRPRRHRSVRRSDRDAGHRRRSASTPNSARPTCSGQAEHGPTSPAVLLTDVGGAARETMRGDRSPADHPADRRRRRRRLGGLRPGHRLRQRRRDGARGRPHRLRARPGDDPRPGFLPRRHDQLRRPVPGRRAPMSPLATR